jgi:hypothetical protein
VLFVIGDHLAGASIGAITALGVRLVVWPGMDMVIAMIAGMTVGMGVHLVLGLALAPVLGMFETMTAGMLVGSYGGMLFAMRDSMSAGSQSHLGAAAVGALFGALLVTAVKLYDLALRGVVVDAER